MWSGARFGSRRNIKHAIGGRVLLCVASPHHHTTVSVIRSLSAVEQPLADAVTALPAGENRYVLAVSGGSDSMVLLHAMAQWAGDRIATVATFDHGTGTHAEQATSLAVHEARLLGLPVVRERAMKPGRTEAEWREARWAFLKRVAKAYKAQVATAHSADDQLETVVQRLLRGTGTRGLAALAAPGPVVRPLLLLSRQQLVAFRESRAIAFVPDPCNQDRRHQRVWVRLDLLPAIARVDAHFARDMLGIAERAAQWRRDVDRLVAGLPWSEVARDTWRLDRSAVAGWSEEQLAVVWPALLGPLGITLDAGGTRRLIRFTIGSERAGQLDLPDGATIVRRGDTLEVRGRDVAAQFASMRASPPARLQVGAPLRWDGWRFLPVPGYPEGSAEPVPLTMAAFPAGGDVEVRRWQAGDRIRTSAAGAGRRISRYLAEYGIPRLDRGGWPVVLLDGEVVWVPGVCRGFAAPHRSGRSDLIWYRSEREFG